MSLKLDSLLTKANLQNAKTEVVVGGSLLASVVAMQLLTDTNPIGRCLVFFKQLGAHVREMCK